MSSGLVTRNSGWELELIVGQVNGGFGDFDNAVLSGEVCNNEVGFSC